MKYTPNKLSFFKRMQPSESVIVFDIGGTWFRRGLVNCDGKLVAVARREAINFKVKPYACVSQLQEELVNYLVNESRQICEDFPEENIRLVGISMGAALNAHTGMILNSGPLWGPNSPPIDLLGCLRQTEPNLAWEIVNDITAALLRYVSETDDKDVRKLMLLTISSGIGCRVFDYKSKTVPVDCKHGLQGEIGHIPITFEYKNNRIQLECDCGGHNHLNAFCSGRGIEKILPIIANLNTEDFELSFLSKLPGELSLKHFTEALLQNDCFAVSILDSITLPVAKMLLNIFTIDPEIERVVLTGGVVLNLGDQYLNSLLRNLEDVGLYQISKYDVSFFRHRIRLGVLDDNSGLMGAAIAAQWQLLSSYRAQDENYQWSIETQLNIRYSVVESSNLFAPENKDILFNEVSTDKLPLRRLIVIDEQVSELYGTQIRQYFEYHKVEYRIVSLHVSEKNKTIDQLLKVIRELDLFEIPRRYEPVIAIGGGVLLDVVGLAVNLYRRGVPLIRIPTTLVGLIDAGIGIKTGINFEIHKNRLGTYYPPTRVLMDKTFLRTLDTRHIRNGLAEILKVAIMKDAELFKLLEDHSSILISEKFQSNGSVPIIVIRRAIQGMLEELVPNFLEHVLERRMDFGHSFSPAIEMKAKPQILHGEAVAIDMAFSVMLAFQRGLIQLSERDRIFKVMKQIELPITHPIIEASFMYKALQDTIRHRDGLQRLPLPTAIGSASFYNDLTYIEIENTVAALKSIE